MIVTTNMEYGQMTPNFTMSDVNTLASIKNLPDAKNFFLDKILGPVQKALSGYATHPGKLALLRHEIEIAKNTNQLTKMATNMLLSGEGLGVLHSTYQKNFKNDKGEWITTNKK